MEQLLAVQVDQPQDKTKQVETLQQLELVLVQDQHRQMVLEMQLGREQELVLVPLEVVQQQDQVQEQDQALQTLEQMEPLLDKVLVQVQALDKLAVEVRLHLEQVPVLDLLRLVMVVQRQDQARVVDLVLQAQVVVEIVEEAVAVVIA